MSEESVTGGRTYPSEIEKYFNKGVKIYNCTNLHAKTYVLGNKVIIASANVSQRSKNDLIEAGLLTTDIKVRKNTLGWLRSLETEPVTPEYIASCKKIFKPPKFSGRHKKGKNRDVPSHSRLWLLSTQETALSDEEQEFCVEREKEAEEKIADLEKYKADTILWDQNSRIAKQIQERDLVIQIENKGKKRKKKTKVRPPSRVVKISVPQELDKNIRNSLFVTLEELRRPHFLAFSDFADEAKQAGVYVSANSQREIRNDEIKNTLLGLWRFI
jgi:hypothetical protein